MRVDPLANTSSGGALHKPDRGYARCAPEPPRCNSKRA